MIDVVGVGDIMPGGLLHGTHDNVVADAVRFILEQGDIRVGTLECAIGNNPIFSEEKMARYGDVIYAPDVDLKRLVDLNINLVSLANNHFFDLKEAGALHTITLLDDLGILHCGAGKDLTEARKPAVFSLGGLRIAFLGFCDYHGYMGWIPFATENTAGVNPMYDDYVLKEINKAKTEYDYVVVMAHWGREHTYETTTWCHRMAKKMIKAGADLILGSHPHRVQPCIRWHKKSVVFSMGNFLFPDRLIAPPLRSTYYTDGPIDLKSLPVTDRFPAVEEVTFKKWKPLARYGMITHSLFSGRSVDTHSNLVFLNDDNHVILVSNNKTMDHALHKYGFLLKNTPYRLVLFLKRIMKRLI